MPKDAGLEAPTYRASKPISRATIIAYCVPMAGFGLLTLPFSIWLMKFSTDVLLIAPATFGALLMVGRIWDAISDPIVGFLSDRSNAKAGRRRSWMLASAIPIFVTTVALWSPPWMLEGTALVLWVGAALLLYETALTAFAVPYGALGMELTEDYHERTRIFGYRHVIAALGSIFGLGAVYLMRTAEEPRITALIVAACASGVLASSILYASRRLPERTDFRGRGSESIAKSFADVFRNPHGRLLFLVYGVETFGAASIGVLAPYVMQYVVKQPDLNEAFILMYFIPQFALTPIWIRLSKKYSKKSLWVFSMSALTVGYSLIFFIGDQSFWYLFICVFLLGLGGGCGNVIAPAIQADVIDYDEYLTGERKEGAYTAIWNFIRKAAAGVAAGITGFVLQYSGYVPNADDQSEAVKFSMMALIGLVPAVCYAFGTLMFMRFSLNQQEHARISAILRERRSANEE